MLGDDLSRDVYCVLGMPIDVGGMQCVLRDIETAAVNKVPFFISAPNLNSLVTMQSDPDFRASFLESDLCPADGMPIVWIARLFGVPIKSRIAGSDIFDALRTGHNAAEPLKVFLFGGPEGAAAAACQTLNAQPGGLYCVGSHYPGFCAVEEMSGDDIINKINSSDADFLVVSLGAKKGQFWLRRNHHRLLVPVRAHLGAVINFQAGTIRRAPLMMQRFGLEWLWRIKEEPYLWRRYWKDGSVLLRLLFTRVLPLAVWSWWLRVKYERDGQDLSVTQEHDGETVAIDLSGNATARHVETVIPALREAILTGKQIIVDFSNTRIVDDRFLGLLLMLRKKLKGRNAELFFTGLSPEVKKIFRFNDLEFLLSKPWSD
jgi:N-acetylglucosaminyldiphosphoundecaprenol N-acetyl-beta-D-mannosaminyltransferase